MVIFYFIFRLQVVLHLEFSRKDQSHMVVIQLFFWVPLFICWPSFSFSWMFQSKHRCIKPMRKVTLNQSKFWEVLEIWLLMLKTLTCDLNFYSLVLSCFMERFAYECFISAGQLSKKMIVVWGAELCFKFLNILCWLNYFWKSILS